MLHRGSRWRALSHRSALPLFQPFAQLSLSPKASIIGPIEHICIWIQPEGPARRPCARPIGQRCTAIWIGATVNIPRFGRRYDHQQQCDHGNELRNSFHITTLIRSARHRTRNFWQEKRTKPRELTAHPIHYPPDKMQTRCSRRGTRTPVRSEKPSRFATAHQSTRCSTRSRYSSSVITPRSRSRRSASISASSSLDG